MTELELEKIFKKPLTCQFLVDDVTHKIVTMFSLLFLWGRMICVTGLRGYQVTALNPDIFINNHEFIIKKKQQQE